MSMYEVIHHREGRPASRAARLLACAALAAALAAGCGDDGGLTQAPGGSSDTTGGPTAGGDTGPGGTRGSACDLLSTDELTGAIGRPFVDPGRGDQVSCYWDSSADEEDVLIEAQVGLDVSFPGFGAEEGLVELADERIDGLGDEAHWDSSLSNLVVVVGDGFISLQVLDTTGVDVRAAALELAELILERL